ncbi:MAG: hypothetical protein DI598_15350 [Pseudopedobacter saltans]|uniref:Phosphatidate cytidylyltransferase n=1 Tax=Pseudopedobacter saltans TaxID=151895 RepID=A0A2W5EHG3_9SPHI|nr:MAG: hypothetical protein DI598_15350 [Pseudopedobacter saltans]
MKKILNLFLHCAVISNKLIEMKKELIGVSIVCMTLLMSSCSAIGAIFKAGMWWGIILVVIVIVLLIWIFSKITGSK